MHVISFPAAVPPAEQIRSDHTRRCSLIHPKTAHIVVSQFGSRVLATLGLGWKIGHKTHILLQDRLAGSKTGSFVAADRIDNGRNTVLYGHRSNHYIH